MASAKNESKSSGSSIEKQAAKSVQTPRFALCLYNTGCEDLVVRKVYPVLKDARAEKEKYLRVVDESGEDYLYPASYFYLVSLPAGARRSLQHTAGPA